MPELDRTHVEEAIDLVKSPGERDAELRAAARLRRLDTLVQYFISEFPADTEGLQVSTDELDNRIRDLLEEARGQPESVATFENGFEQLPSEITSIPLEQYKLGVPLNISPGFPRDELKFQDTRFERVPRDEWMDRFAEPALDDNGFSEHFEEVPNDFDEGYTYWEFEYEARDPEHVLETTERHLGVILGQLIYCLFPWSHTNQFGGGTVWNRPWSELRLPFVYILRDQEGYHDAYFGDDISPRHSIRMFGDRRERIETRYQTIPQFDDPNDVDQKLINAFRNFQSGATEPNRRQAFLDYWRAVETLCVFGDERMKIVAHRAKAVIGDDNGDELLERRLEEIKDKRNSLVHEKVGVTITQRDNEFLRSILYNLVEFMISKRGWDPEEIKLWLDNASKPDGQLTHKLDQLENEMDDNRRDAEVIRNILGSR